MKLDNAVKAGNFLQYAAQPALVTAASYGFHVISKNRLPGSSVAAMFIVHSVASHFFAPKAVEHPSIHGNRIAIPLGSTVFTILASFASSKFRVEGRHREGMVCVVGLGTVYVLISLLVNVIAHEIYRRAERPAPTPPDQPPPALEKQKSLSSLLFKHDACSKPHQEIESQLAAGILVTTAMKEKIALTWQIIEEEIKKMHKTSSQVRYNWIKGYIDNPSQQTFNFLSPENVYEVTQILAEKKITLFNKKVFALKAYPNLIFKRVEKAAFDVLVSHQCICKTFNLTELVIPQSIFIEIEDLTFVAQKKLDFNEDKQPYYYLKHAARLEKAVLQLRIYILQSGETDVEWRNMPVIGNLKDKNSNLQFALIDHEILPGARPEWGIVGNDLYHRRGLIGLLCEEQAQRVAELSQEPLKEFGQQIQQALQKRRDELKERNPVLEKIQEFKEWANARKRKSIDPITNFTNIPTNLTSDQQDLMTDIQKHFNQELAKQNPKHYASRYDLRTLELTVNKPTSKGDESTLSELIESTLSMLKETDNIFDFQLNQPDLSASAPDILRQMSILTYIKITA